MSGSTRGRPRSRPVGHPGGQPRLVAGLEGGLGEPGRPAAAADAGAHPVRRAQPPAHRRPVEAQLRDPGARQAADRLARGVERVHRRAPRPRRGCAPATRPSPPTGAAGTSSVGRQDRPRRRGLGREAGHQHPVGVGRGLERHGRGHHRPPPARPPRAGRRPGRCTSPCGDTHATRAHGRVARDGRRRDRPAVLRRKRVRHRVAEGALGDLAGPRRRVRPSGPSHHIRPGPPP